MLSPSVIEQVKDAAQIEDVVRSYGVNLRRRGASMWANCPFPGHEEKTPSFCVTPAKGICKCFGCGRGGDAVSFVREMENVSYVEAIKSLAKRYNIDIDEREMTDDERKQHEKRESLFAINEFACQWFEQQMWETQEGQSVAWQYFNNRGIREDVARVFHLGYSPNFAKALFNAATENGFKPELLDELGLCRQRENEIGNYRDFFRGRIMFPIHTAAGRVIAFGGRILEKRDDIGKYFNSKESDEFYIKSRELYGLFQARSEILKKDHCYLCEGYMDVIAMHQNGLKDVVASCGTSLTEEQAKRISRNTLNVTILYDGDKAGIKAAKRAIDLLLPNKVKINVLVLPDDDDPDSFARKHAPAEYIEYIESHQTNWIDYLLQYAFAESLTDINKITETVGAFVEKLALIPDDIYRDICIRSVAEKLHFSSDIITKQVEAAVRAIERKPLPPNHQPYRQPSGGATTTTPTTTTQQPAQPTGEKPTLARPALSIYAKNILQLLLRYGNHKLFEGTADECLVAEFIIENIRHDGILFDDPVLQQIFDEYAEIHSREGFDVEEEFLTHPNPEVQKVAFELLIDRYQLSKFFEIENVTLPLTTGKHSEQEEEITTRHMPSDADNLADLVPKVVFEYKLELVKIQIDDLMQQLQNLEPTEQNNEQFQELLQELNFKNEFKQNVAQYLKKVLM